MPAQKTPQAPVWQGRGLLNPHFAETFAQIRTIECVNCRERSTPEDVNGPVEDSQPNSKGYCPNCGHYLGQCLDPDFEGFTRRAYVPKKARELAFSP